MYCLASAYVSVGHARWGSGALHGWKREICEGLPVLAIDML